MNVACDLQGHHRCVQTQQIWEAYVVSGNSHFLPRCFGSYNLNSLTAQSPAGRRQRPGRAVRFGRPSPWARNLAAKWNTVVTSPIKITMHGSQWME